MIFNGETIVEGNELDAVKNGMEKIKDSLMERELRFQELFDKLIEIKGAVK